MHTFFRSSLAITPGTAHPPIANSWLRSCQTLQLEPIMQRQIIHLKAAHDFYVTKISIIDIKLTWLSLEFLPKF